MQSGGVVIFVVPPNRRVQRTRSSPSAPHSPPTRHPLDRKADHADDLPASQV